MGSTAARCCVAAIALAASACADPTVSVTFDVPARYAPLVATVRLRVLDPAGSAPIDCAAVAYGDVSDDALDAATKLEVSVARPTEDQPLSGIARAGRKLFVAEGLDTARERVVAACAERGDVDDDLDVILAAEPAAEVATSVVAGDDGQPPSLVTATAEDALGAPLGGHPLRWTTVGPAGARVDVAVATGADGAASREPTPTSLAGPALLDVATRWMRREPDAVRYFQTPRFAESWALETGKVDPRLLHVFRDPLRAGAGFALPALVSDCGCAFPTTPPACVCPSLAVVRRGFDAAPPSPVVDYVALPPDARALGRWSASGTDHVIVRGTERWYELAIAASGAPSLTPIAFHAAETPHDAADVPTNVVDVAACAGAGPARVLVAFAASAPIAFAPDDGWAPVASAFAGQSGLSDVAASGCATGGDGELHRAVAYRVDDASGAGLRLVADLEGALPSERLGGGAFGSLGFSDRSGLERPLLLGTLDADGFAIERHHLAKSPGGRLELVRVDRDRTALPPMSPAAGDLDGDGSLDVVALLLAEQVDVGAYRQAVFAALGATYRGRRLAATVPAGDLANATLRIADFDGDGFDDVLIVADGSVSVVLMGPGGGGE